MPKLWNETIEEHRRDVRDAILEATWELVTERGLTSVKMSHVAQKTGIGRATLYKYFPDIEAILLARHERHVAEHLDQLVEIRDQGGDPMERLQAVLATYAMISHRRGSYATNLMALLHRDEHIEGAHEQLSQVIRDLLAEAADAGTVRDDVDPDELARYCLHALSAASNLPSKAAVERLLTITLAGLSARCVC